MEIIVRPANSVDLDAVRLLVDAQGLPYDAPDWAAMDVSAVIERDGVISSAFFLRRTAETYLLFNPAVKLRKRERLGELQILDRELPGPAARAGFTDIHCWLPPELERRHFGRLLMHMGWTKPLWTSYSRKVKL